MKKWIALVCSLALVLALAGCGGSNAAKVIKEREDRIFGYSWTKDDASALAAIRYDEAMDKWASEVADKIAQDQYQYYEVGSLMSCLESAGYENAYLQEQATQFEIRWLVGLKEEAFAAGDWESVMTYLGKVQLHGKDLPLESIMPYQELKDYLLSYETVQPITENGLGGYYDDKQGDYKNDVVIDDTLTTKSWSYEFFGDFMMRVYSKENYRPTGEAWEEQLLSKYDYDSVTFYYQGQVVELSGNWVQLHTKGQTYMIADGEDWIVFLITPDAVLIHGRGLFEYN